MSSAYPPSDDTIPRSLTVKYSFGFLDGISQPAVDGVDTSPNPGQETVPQGIILLGRDKDTTSVPNVTRPSWALDGSFLSFRHLSQLVPEFDAFQKQNPIPGVPPEIASDLLGARLVGRWKSGTLSHPSFFRSLGLIDDDDEQEHPLISLQPKTTPPWVLIQPVTTTSAIPSPMISRRKTDAPLQPTSERPTLEPTLKITAFRRRPAVSFVRGFNSDLKSLPMKLPRERLNWTAASSSPHTRATFPTASNSSSKVGRCALSITPLTARFAD